MFTLDNHKKLNLNITFKKEIFECHINKAEKSNVILIYFRRKKNDVVFFLLYIAIYIYI